jgi:uncharacterized membrane protein YdjX (TVP38/TMEM64 family)
MTCPAVRLSTFAMVAARDRIQEIANKNAKFKAIDKAIGRNSLKIVTLLRLSPLLPLALSNYLYGLTSVDLGSYVLGSWAGMLPGTIAYVAAGAFPAFTASRSFDTLIWHKLRVCSPPTEGRLEVSMNFALGRIRVELVGIRRKARA